MSDSNRIDGLALRTILQPLCREFIAKRLRTRPDVFDAKRRTHRKQAADKPQRVFVGSLGTVGEIKTLSYLDSYRRPKFSFRCV